MLASLRSFHNRALREHRQVALKTLLSGLKQGQVGTLNTIGSITEDQALSDAEKVARIRTWLAKR